MLEVLDVDLVWVCWGFLVGDNVFGDVNWLIVLFCYFGCLGYFCDVVCLWCMIDVDLLYL